MAIRLSSAIAPNILKDYSTMIGGRKPAAYFANPTSRMSLLHYIYTGNVEVNEKPLLLDVIAAAEEMELDELSTQCQAKVIGVLNQVISNEDDNDGPDHMKFEGLPLSMAVQTFLIPALTLAYQHTLPGFFQKLLDFTFDHMEYIFTSTTVLTVFLDEIPSNLLKQIIVSDSLTLSEYEIWELAFSWACRQAKVLKPMVESQLKLNKASEWNEDMDPTVVSDARASSVDVSGADQPLVSAEQLDILKTTLSPLTLAIRFTLMDPEDFLRTFEVLTYFLPARRSMELQRFFLHPDKKISLEAPRSAGKNSPSKIADRFSFRLLKSWIFEANTITGCNSSACLQFKLLHQASVHGFEATKFHQNCDNQGPTLVLVRTSDGYQFGGVNFNPWTSNNAYSNSNDNFLFALKTKHRRVPATFKIISNNQQGALNNSGYGPTFGGGHDMHICNNPHLSTNSYSNLPTSYNGSGASNATLAGARNFMVADYEVFAISKEFLSI